MKQKVSEKNREKMRVLNEMTLNALRKAGQARAKLDRGEELNYEEKYRLGFISREEFLKLKEIHD